MTGADAPPTRISVLDRTPDAYAALGELPGWAGSTLFDERERAALALTESVTLVHDGGVPDDVYRRAAAHFDDDRLAVLLWTVATINVYNRLAIATGLTAGAPSG